MSRVRDEAMSMQDRVFTVNKLSQNMEQTPEGYLLCRNVPLARTGSMDYGPREVPDEMWSSAARDGRITIQRFAEDVFAPQFVDSLQGKSVVIKHPQKNVDPHNWKDVEIGIVLNPHRGTGVDVEMIIGDLLIKDADAIQYVRNHMPEVSVGYEADYAEYEPGKWKQVPLIANHVALVDAGRCGSQCGIRDSGENMKTHDNKTVNVLDAAWFADWKKRLAAAYGVNDQKAIDAIISEAAPQPPASGIIHIMLGGVRRAVKDGDEIEVDPKPAAKDDDEPAAGRIDGLEKRVGDHDTMLNGHNDKHTAHDAAIEAINAHLGLSQPSNEQIQNDPGEEAPPGTSPADARSAKDSAMFADAFQFARAGAEILHPGITLPTFDAKATAISTANGICSLRRKALDRANLSAEGRDMIESIHGKPLVLDSLKCGDVRVLFNAVVAVAKTRNTQKARVGDGKSTIVLDNKDAQRRTMTGEEINKRNAAFYKNQNA